MDILIVIIATAFIQSLFGVGVLLFGTPLLLLLGYPFMESLLILLPISASINALQIIKDYKYINIKIYKQILIFTVPFIVLFLFIISKVDIDINIAVGLFLIFIALKEHIVFIQSFFTTILSYNKLFYSTMGMVHGLTNLGGALLTAKVFHTNLNKYEKRATIAMSYMTFAVFQIITILFLDNNFGATNFWYIIVGVIVYVGINKLFFHKMSEHKYDKLFSFFLLISGISLVLKGLIW